MFNEKTYPEVNREERNYCFLFGHALLMSKAMREGFARLAQDRLGVALDPDAFEVFVEAAALRDYWYDLGDPSSYNTEIDARRRAVVKKILGHYDKSLDLIDQQDFFWTKSMNSKLWYPSHWNIEALKLAGLDDLVKVKWAFNAKPDILIVTPSSMLVIEAKIESPEGCKADKEKDFIYQQLKIQDLIIEMWKLLIPKFQNKICKLALLDVRGGEKGFAWSEIIELVDKSEVDDFTRRSMASLKRYYSKRENEE